VHKIDKLIRKSSRLRCLFTSCLLLLLAAQLSGCVSVVRPNYTQTLGELRSGDYSLDPEHVYVHFSIEHLGLSTVVGRFNSVDATLNFDPESLEQLRLDGVIDVASIDMNNESLENRLRGDDWLDTRQFPEARFRTQNITAAQNNDFVITGDFSLRGVTRPLSLNATFKGGADNLLTGKYTLGFSASGSFFRSEFGIDAFAALVADEVFIEIHAEFQKNN
jgi:polyisoprenoid-binding protein YceI